uniref:Uncharacterized protein n=1 Tax=Oryza glumipatula TaxID=40148 RepID=A0A0E0BTS6_9ORYZ
MHQAPVVDVAETSVPDLGMKPPRSLNGQATPRPQWHKGCCRRARCPPVRCHAADERARAAISEDSTIKCTMTQFEDQFSTIKHDGIQVRCHKYLG